jgi:hypothetical protein
MLVVLKLYIDALCCELLLIFEQILGRSDCRDVMVGVHMLADIDQQLGPPSGARQLRRL